MPRRWPRPGPCSTGSGDRPLPREDLRRASARLRAEIARPGWPGKLLIECSGMRAKDLPADDAELWLRLAAGVASPQGPDDWDRPGLDDGEPDEAESELTAICAIDHFDWLAAITALVEGGPGTSASAADLAAYVRDYDPEDTDDDPDDGADADEDEDEPTISSSPLTTNSTTSPWRACSCRSPRCGRCSARSMTTSG